MLKKLQKFMHRKAALPVLCYLLAAAVWLAGAAFRFGADALGRAGGALAEQTLAASAFQLADLTPAGAGENGAEVLVTSSADPQMILEPVAGAIEGSVVRTLRLYCTFDTDPREMCLYYTTAAGQPYSQDRRVFPVQQADGSYLFTLPRGRIEALRLDPCSPDENRTVTLAVQKIVLNTPVGAAGYFLPSWYQAFCLVLYPALAAAALSWLARVAHTLALRRKKA